MRLCLPVVLLFAACSTQRYFTPRENTNGTGPGGHPAAVYALGGPPAQGEVRVWSGGADFLDGEADVVELHIGFELENTGAEPLAIDTTSLQCTDLWIDDQRSGPLEPVRVSGQFEAAPGASASADAWFRPAAARARDLDAFTLRFTVRSGDRVVLQQAVPFQPFLAADRWRDDHFWYGGYGGRPYYHWGPGFGFGFYGHTWCH